MLFAALLSIILSFVAGRPVPAKLGVDVTKAGKLKVAVDGPVLKVSTAHCSGRYLIQYATTDTGTTSPGFCALGEGGGAEIESSKCTLKLDAEELLEMETISLPPGCSLKLTNAYLPEENENESSGVPVVAIIVPCVIVGIILIAVLVTVVVCCYKRRKTRAARAAKAAADAQKTNSDSVPIALTTPLPSSVAPTSTVPPSATEAAADKKPSTEQTSTTPVPPSSAADVNKKPSEEKVSATPAPTATVPSNVPAVKEAPTTVDDVLEDTKPKPRSKRPPHWTDREGHLSAARIHESYEDVRSRGSKLSKRTGKSRKSKADSLDDRRKDFETVVECLGRHGVLEQFKAEEMIISRTPNGDGPTEYLRMQKRYHDDVVRVVDKREKELLVSRVSKQFKIVQELSSEAEELLKKQGVVFPPDGQRATVPDEARKFLMQPSTPAFVQMFAFGAEYGWVIPVQKGANLRKIFPEYSVQTLLVVALHPFYPERTRRKALAAMSRRISCLLPQFDHKDFSTMAYPLRILPDALATNPDFFKKINDVKTNSKGSEEAAKKDEKCGKKKENRSVDEEAKRSKEGGKPKACPKKRPSTSREDRRTSASRTSMERSTESKQEKTK